MSPKFYQRNVFYLVHINSVISITCPAAIFPKILLQQTWEIKIGWDEEVPEDLKRFFISWVKQIEVIAT